MREVNRPTQPTELLLLDRAYHLLRRAAGRRRGVRRWAPRSGVGWGCWHDGLGALGRNTGVALRNF